MRKRRDFMAIDLAEWLWFGLRRASAAVIPKTRSAPRPLTRSGAPNINGKSPKNLARSMPRGERFRDEESGRRIVLVQQRAEHEPAVS
jgi:hypothetical protein